MKQLMIHFLLVLSLIKSPFLEFNYQTPAVVKFRNASVENHYPDGLTFRIEICGRENGSKVVFNYKVAGTFRFAWKKEKWTVDQGQTADNCEKRLYVLETKDLDVPPFSAINYYWTISNEKGIIAKSSVYNYYYRDPRYNWQTLNDEHLIIWWHDRSDAFGQHVKFVAQTALQQQQTFYSFSLEKPITIVILNSFGEFFAWQSEEDYAAGLAFANDFLTLQVVESESDSEWLDDVVPHEISHIYLNNLVKGYSGASNWFDEGLATYFEYSDHSIEWENVRNASETGSLLPLESIQGPFGDDPEKVDLAYAESYYAILYMDEVYGQNSIKTLLTEYNHGASSSTAFQKSFGKTPDEFDADFVKWLENRIKTLPPQNRFPRTIISNLAGIEDVYLFVVVGLLLVFPLVYGLGRFTLKRTRKIIGKRR